MYTWEPGPEPSPEEKMRRQIERLQAENARLAEERETFNQLFSHEREKHNATIAQRDLARRRYSFMARAITDIYEIICEPNPLKHWKVSNLIACMIQSAIQNEADDKNTPHPSFTIKPRGPAIETLRGNPQTHEDGSTANVWTGYKDSNWSRLLALCTQNLVRLYEPTEQASHAVNGPLEGDCV